MKVVGLCFGVLALAFAASGQAQAPGARVTASHITQVSQSRVTATGDVQITIGTTVITADAADIQDGGPGMPSDITLTGTVRVRAFVK